jgi:hypothetical protein
MHTFLFKCPSTGWQVQGSTGRIPATDPDSYEVVDCSACGMMHFVNPHTGRVLGEGTKD